MADMPSRPDDRARALLRDEPEAFDAWFRAEHAVVWRLCFGLLADDAEADDLAQDAMLHLHDHLHAWDTRRPYASWRNAVVANLCRDRLRRAAARRGAESAAAEAGLPDRLPAPEDGARRAEVRAALRAALGALSPREREVFVLRELEGAATSDVAATLGVEPGSVRSLLTLARRRMRTLLADRLPGLVPDGRRP
jgi:RNA polymerase sigma-70 factor (ECF subfamily)